MRPVVAITIGDPAGIGPEVLLRGLPDLLRRQMVPLAVGDAAVLRRTAEAIGCDSSWAETDGSFLQEGTLNLLCASVITTTSYPVGADSALCGRASYTYVERAVALVREGKAHALVTLPISKKSWELAGIPYAGHTELLRDRAGASDCAMVMAADRVRALLLTTHLPLAEAISRLSIELICKKATIGQRFLEQIGIKNGTMALAAVNPHAGEGGLLGSEETRIFLPAVETLNLRGIRCEGPVPADAVFRMAADGKYDLVLCPYHDQAMIPLKTFWFDRLVNITAGIGMVRTSPGHGTAYDIAYRGLARWHSFLAACDWACALLRGSTPPASAEI